MPFWMWYNSTYEERTQALEGIVMESTHRAKIELSYTRTMKERLQAKTAEKLKAYDEKIARLEKQLQEAESK